MGSRYGGIKQLAAFGPNGETLLDYSIRDAIDAGFQKVVFISRKEILADTQALFCPKWENKVALEFVLQEITPSFSFPTIQRSKPWGVTQAVLSAQSVINAPFAVLNADDFYGKEAFHLAQDFLQKEVNPSTQALIGYPLYATLSQHGGVSRGICQIDETDFLQAIKEQHNIQKGENEGYFIENGNPISLEPQSLVSMNFWCFHPCIFPLLTQVFEDFAKKNAQNPSAELPLPPAIDVLMKTQDIKVKVLPNLNGNWFGITYKEDDAEVRRRIKEIS